MSSASYSWYSAFEIRPASSLRRSSTMRFAYSSRVNVPSGHIRGRANATWMHFARDLVAASQHVLAGTLAPSAYLASFRLPIAFAAFAWDDPVPGLLELPLSLYRALSRRVPFMLRASNGIRSALAETTRVLWRAG